MIESPPLSAPFALDNTSKDPARPPPRVICYRCGEPVRPNGGIQVRAAYSNTVLQVIIHPQCPSSTQIAQGITT